MKSKERLISAGLFVLSGLVFGPSMIKDRYLNSCFKSDSNGVYQYAPAIRKRRR
jgi:hypothetical protein